MVNRDNRLFIVANTYYSELEKIGCTVLHVDKNFDTISLRKIFYPFKKLEEGLHQVMLAGDDLLILKTSHDTAGNTLQLIKANINSGKLLVASFSSGNDLLLSPLFKYRSADSSILIYSMLQRTLFITRLDHSLKEISPITLLKSQFKNGVASNFLLLHGDVSQWISLNSGRRRISARQNNNISSDLNSMITSGSSYDDYPNAFLRERPSTYYYEQGRGEVAVRFTQLNDELTVTKDSVVLNDKDFYALVPGSFATIQMNNNSYLFLSQRFGTKGQGLVMMYAKDSALATTDIRVYDKYQYSLLQMQQVNNEYVIMPFTYKHEMGLIKITLDK